MSMEANSGALARRFCRAATKMAGFTRRAMAMSDRLVVSLSVPATNLTASSTLARSTTAGSSPLPMTIEGSSAGGSGVMTVTSNPSARRSAVSSRPNRPYPQTTHRPVVGGCPRAGSSAPGPFASQVMSWYEAGARSDSRRWSPKRSNGFTTVGVPKAPIRWAIAGEVVRAITGSSGRSSVAAMVIARFASSSSVSASTPSQYAWSRPAVPN
jgi:hypothetical protein